MKLGKHEVGPGYRTYFIADIGSNHDGSFDRAERLIYKAAEAGTDAVKFQNFKADTIVSDYGFKSLGKQSHQSNWRESVYDTYKRYEVPLEWTPRLKKAADKAGVDFLTTPYNPNILNYLAEYVCAWKVGSGDITYDALINALTEFDKPILLGTGASSEADILRVLGWLKGPLVLMQCNTNYTGSPDNFEHVNLRVLQRWGMLGGAQQIVLGFSDHTPGHTAVLGAVALGACVVEKHFTDDNSNQGPDHSFAMNPQAWRDMVDSTRELEQALGHGRKEVEENERETVVLQRRAIRAKRDILAGAALEATDFQMLRPCPLDALPPYRLGDVVGRSLAVDIQAGDYVRAEWLVGIEKEL